MIKVSRAEWGARPPKATPLLIQPNSETDHWEGTPMGVFVHDSCATKVRAIQAFHMDARGWNDIAYNFVVCPHGYVFVGRDHGIRSAANGTNYANQTSQANCYLGGVGDVFTDAAKSALKELNDETTGVTFPHQHWFNTACPGPDIVNWLNAGQPTDGGTSPPLPPNQPPFPTFPLPPTEWFGEPNPNPHNHSGYYLLSDRMYVALLQKGYNMYAGQNLKEDGYYGKATGDACENFQRFFKLTVDRLTGPQTWNLLTYIARKQP